MIVLSLKDFQIISVLNINNIDSTVSCQQTNLQKFMRQFVELELACRHISGVRITSEITMLGATQVLRNTMGVGSVLINTDQHLEGERFNVITVTKGRG